MNTSRLLIHENPLQVLPSLVMKIGLNEAIILQQIHYWLQTSPNEKEERKWTYNTYADWRKQFPWWSEKTIQRTMLSLEESGIIMTEKFNTSKYDHTKWYTINYEHPILTNSDEAGGQIVAFNKDSMSQTMTTENTTEKNNTNVLLSDPPFSAESVTEKPGKEVEGNLPILGVMDSQGNYTPAEKNAGQKEELDKDGLPPVAKYVRYFAALYKHYFKSEYQVNWAKDMATMKRVRAVQRENTKELIEMFFESDDEFLQKAGYTIGVFSTQVNKLNASKAQIESLRPVFDPPQKGDVYMKTMPDGSMKTFRYGEEDNDQ